MLNLIKTDISRRSIIALAAIIILQLTVIAVICRAEDMSHNEDEFFSYALSNSYYRPFNYGSAHMVFDNYNTWETGDMFKYYIRTNKNTRFKYDSVIYNQAQDIHPPLFYMVLHTISSVFADKFSWWWGYSVNFVCFALTQVLLFLLFKRLKQPDALCLFICLFYGFANGVQENCTFIRMYTMVTMLGLMFVYKTVEMLQKEKTSIVGDGLVLLLICFLGGYTEYVFIVFAFFYTLLLSIYFVCRKQFAKMFEFGLPILFGTAAVFAAFPYAFDDIFNSPLKARFTGTPEPVFQTHLFFRTVVMALTGINMSDKHNITLFAAAALAAVLAVYILKNGREGLKQKISVFTDADRPYIITAVIFAACILHMICMASTIYYYDISEGVVRYLYIIMPYICGIVIAAVYHLLHRAGNMKLRRAALVSVIVLAAVDLAVQNYNAHFNRTYPYAENGTVREWVSGKNGILMVPSPIWYPCYPEMMQDAKNIYLTLSLDEIYKRHPDEYLKLTQEDEFFLAFDSEQYYYYSDIPFEDVLGYFSDITGYKWHYCTTEHPLVASDVMVYMFTKEDS